MTESDQHAVLGRLMFENKEAAERLAINHEKAKQMWRDMSAAVKAMEWELNATDPCENIRKNFPPPAKFDEFEKRGAMYPWSVREPGVQRTPSHRPGVNPSEAQGGQGSEALRGCWV